MTNRFTNKAQRALGNAMSIASKMGHTYIGSEHLLMGILMENTSAGAQMLADAQISFEAVKTIVEQIAGVGSESNVSASDMTPRTKRIIENSAYICAKFNEEYIGTEHLLLAMLSEDDCVAVKIIENSGASIEEIKNKILSMGASESNGTEMPNSFGAKSISKKNPQAADNSLKDAPTLSQYGKNLTAIAKSGKTDPIIGRDEEMDRVIQILCRRTKNNPCLIGEPGVGKTAVVEGLAQRIANNEVPELLSNKIVVSVDLAGMLAGAKYRGEFEERIKGVMNEVAKNKNIILFIDEIHTIVGAGAAEGAVDAANIIKPALSRGEMQLIGATTIDEYRKNIEKDAALERRFAPVNVKEPTPEESVEILKGLRDKYEAHHKVKITDEAIEAAVKLSVRYIGDRYLPDKAIDLIDEACSKLRIKSYTVPSNIKDLEEKCKRLAHEKEDAIKNQNFEEAAKFRDEERTAKESFEQAKTEWNGNKNGNNLSIGEEDICDIVAGWTGIPVKKLAEEEEEKLKNLDKILGERVIGQKEAIDAVSRAIRRGRVGLKDPNRPMGSFIFLGPTGVGKTELTKALAEVLFGDENSMIRIDMSEYMEKHSVSKLIGSPPGYVGFEDGGQLTEKIRRKPYSVVLFDEIEKAHPDVFNIMLQILDEGTLTDSKGRKVDFKNSVIIMTSNAGASNIVRKTGTLGFGDTTAEEEKENIKDRVMESLKATFKPEFLNRVDDIIVFNKLTEEEIKQICVLMLKSVNKRAKGIGVELTFDDSVVEVIAKNGFDEMYGARPIRREIQKSIEDELSNAMLEGKIKEGDCVKAIYRDAHVIFETIQA